MTRSAHISSVGVAVVLLCVVVGGWAVLRPASAERVSVTPPPAPPTPATSGGRDMNARAGDPLILFADIAREAGIDFVQFDGHTRMQYSWEQTSGAGIAWLDYDRDGRMDLLLVQGMTALPPHPAPPPTTRLFRNLGGGRFVDVTVAAGIGHVGCGQGVAVGDIDNDGYPDVFVSCYGKPNVFYRNVPDGQGGRRFEDQTARAGLGDHPDWKDRENFSTSVAFLDADGDGRLDLFVCSYVHVNKGLAGYPVCQDRRGEPDACGPKEFAPTRCLLYRNLGDGRFADVTAASGVGVMQAKALGVVALDLDDDGRTDLFVANDSMPNFFFRNLGGGRFEEVALQNGCALNMAGQTQAYMGVDADDLDGDGRPDLYATAFTRETDTFFKNLGGGRFLDRTAGSGLGPSTFHPLAWGCCFLDADLDGHLDIAVVNGHVSFTVDDDGNPDNVLRQSALLFRNLGGGRFRDVSAHAGPYFRERHIGRGVAWADLDDDGRPDLAVTNRGGPLVLLHNRTVTPHHWLRLELEGTASNRDAVGARVTVKVPTGAALVRHRKGGGSYGSSSDPRLLIGVGAATTVPAVEVRWPSGATQTFGPLAADRGYRLVEGEAAARPAAGQP